MRYEDWAERERKLGSSVGEFTGVCVMGGPFADDEPASLAKLRNWLGRNVPAELMLTSTYSAGELVSHLDEIMGEMILDGIDVRGDDA